MKGDSSTKIYSSRGCDNYDQVETGQEMTGPYVIWKNRITGKELRLPTGVTGGKNWERINHG